MPGYILRPDVSFCDAGGRHIFLDLAADRYFYLSSDTEAAFARLVAGRPLNDIARRTLGSLLSQGLLTVVDGDVRPIACRHPPRPPRSLLDKEMAVPALRQARAAAFLLVARAQLHFRPLLRLTSRLQRKKARMPEARKNGCEAQLTEIAADFQAAGLIVGSLDQCLAVSLAVSDRALTLGIAADLVLGVRLRPFQAHAWVQTDDIVVNDTVDHIAQFTPILVI